MCTKLGTHITIYACILYARVGQSAAVEWRIRKSFEKELEAADGAIAARIDEEQRRVEALKKDIGKLLDQLQVSSNQHL